MIEREIYREHLRQMFVHGERKEIGNDNVFCIFVLFFVLHAV